MDRATALELAEVFRSFEADDAARTAVLTGSGSDFCAGADLHEIAAGRPNRVEELGADNLALGERYLLARLV
ncbi:MAG: enoyl-CoA hydratase, partial [Myxococcales bacterium]|nr:enoyl-CoA hydratase [Myxococcales bacterium]